MENHWVKASPAVSHSTHSLRMKQTPMHSISTGPRRLVYCTWGGIRLCKGLPNRLPASQGPSLTSQLGAGVRKSNACRHQTETLNERWRPTHLVAY